MAYLQTTKMSACLPEMCVENDRAKIGFPASYEATAMSSSQLIYKAMIWHARRQITGTFLIITLNWFIYHLPHKISTNACINARKVDKV